MVEFVSWLMDSISAFVLHPGNLRLLETLIVKTVEFLKQMIATVKIIKTIICEHHHPVLKALQQKKLLMKCSGAPPFRLTRTSL